jgi:glutathione S-transferase
MRALIALLFDGIPDPAAFAGAGGATLARCAGAIDFARLEADITAACTRVRAWYDRLIARPARRIAPSRPGEPDIDATGESA